MSDRARMILVFTLAVLGGAILLYACNADALPKAANPLKIVRCSHD
jgi:hypothetical protein